MPGVLTTKQAQKLHGKISALAQAKVNAGYLRTPEAYTKAALRQKQVNEYIAELRKGEGQ